MEKRKGIQTWERKKNWVYVTSYSSPSVISFLLEILYEWIRYIKVVIFNISVTTVLIPMLFQKILIWYSSPSFTLNWEFLLKLNTWPRVLHDLRSLLEWSAAAALRLQLLRTWQSLYKSFLKPQLVSRTDFLSPKAKGSAVLSTFLYHNLLQTQMLR